MKIPGLMTVDELTRYLDCSRRQLDRLRRQDRFPSPATVIGRQLFYDEEAVKLWVAGCAQGGDA